MAPTNVPPPVGKNVPVRITTDEFRDDLATLMRNGTNASDAIRTAVRHLASAYRRAWLNGTTPQDHDPHVPYCGETRPVQPTPVGGSEA